MGHSIQYSEASRQNPINAITQLGRGRRPLNLSMIELGSEFGEALLRGWLLRNASSQSGAHRGITGST